MSDNNRLKPSSSIPVGSKGSRIDPSTMATTPGGTIFGTTPGGTRIAYSKDALLELSRSPLSKNIPKGLKEIPGVTDKNGSKLENDQKSIKSPIKNDGSDEVFEMDI